jgi:hypothetical protein
MKPAILIPYKNRRDYLDVFLEKVPRYLEDRNGIRDYVIYIAEQADSDVFNVSLSRNVAAKFALAENKTLGYMIFHDVDIIPVENIDYGPRQQSVTWFIGAGSCKVLAADFLKANGYNPRFLGWGYEDTEFYHRLCCLNCEVREWHMSKESKNAVMLNLEMGKMSDSEALSWSRRYFGYTGEGPLYQPFHRSDGQPGIEKYDKASDFFIQEYREKNDRLWTTIHSMPHAEKLDYFKANGLNLVDLSGVHVKDRAERMVWLKYESNAVLLDD